MGQWHTREPPMLMNRVPALPLTCAGPLGAVLTGLIKRDPSTKAFRKWEEHSLSQLQLPESLPYLWDTHRPSHRTLLPSVEEWVLFVHRAHAHRPSAFALQAGRLRKLEIDLSSFTMRVEQAWTVAEEWSGAEPPSAFPTRRIICFHSVGGDPEASRCLSTFLQPS